MLSSDDDDDDDDDDDGGGGTDAGDDSGAGTGVSLLVLLETRMLVVAVVVAVLVAVLGEFTLLTCALIFCVETRADVGPNLNATEDCRCCCLMDGAVPILEGGLKALRSEEVFCL